MRERSFPLSSASGPPPIVVGGQRFRPCASRLLWPSAVGRVSDVPPAGRSRDILWTRLGERRVTVEPNDDTCVQLRCRLLCQNEYVRVVSEDLRLAGVLETVLCYASEQQDEMERFYENVLGLESLGLGRWSLAFRLGHGVVLLFDRERSSTQDRPPPHGASGSIHAAFLAAPDQYDAWKQRLADRGVTLIEEIAWGCGARSYFFNDPASNKLEIAERDLWPG
jgi:catechol 2,3-dioxygenase-like lactoylglutathione lyase family enzyme